MTPSNHDFDFSSYSLPQFAFESIGVSAWRAGWRLIEARLAASSLIGSFFEYRSKSTTNPCEREVCKSVFQQYEYMEEGAAYTLWEETRRHTLLTAISVLDSFLSDSLRFLFLYKPLAIPENLPEKRQSNEPDADFVERIVRRSRRFSSQKKRIDFLSEFFKVPLDVESLTELARLTTLRNEIAHHSGFYRFVIDPATGDLRSEEKPLPLVTEKDASKIAILVGEVCDSIFVAMSLSIFGVEPNVRPVNSEMAVLYKEIRNQWAVEELESPVITEFPNPNWSMKTLDDPKMPWVGDEAGAWIVIPSGTALLPPSILFSWNTRHGVRAWATVDGNSREGIDNYSYKLVDQMTTGQTILVEYYDKNDGPQFARFSLIGFAEAWCAACRRKEEGKCAS